MLESLARAESSNAVTKRSLRWRIVLAVAVLIVGLAWLQREPILRQIGTWWVVSDEPVKADAIVVLGGDFDVRPFAAAELYKRKLAATILLSNVLMGKAERLGLIPSHTELNREVLLRLDVPASAILTFGENLLSTQQEAAAVRQWALQSQAKRVIVPTELLATRRTRWIFERELEPIGVQVVVSAYPADRYKLDNWWRDRTGVVDFNNEVLKYLYYRIRY
jgi:uncharacterized SAM-binding protein YcdF (DUF218 family)